VHGSGKVSAFIVRIQLDPVRVHALLAGARGMARFSRSSEASVCMGPNV
jgi:hypothetical protein